MAQIFRLDNPLLGRGLKLSQRLSYLAAMLHFFSGIPRLVFGGMVLGVVAAFIFSHYLESLLYQVKSGDIRTFIGVLLTLGAVAGIACYIPARRATRVNPMEALRYE